MHGRSPHLHHLQQMRSCLDSQLQSQLEQDSPFDYTSPLQEKSVDSISELFSLNVPRGTLFGNSNPLAPHYKYPTVHQGAGLRYRGYQNQYEQPPMCMSTPKKVLKSLNMTPTSPYPAIPPICPPVISCDTDANDWNIIIKYPSHLLDSQIKTEDPQFYQSVAIDVQRKSVSQVRNSGSTWSTWSGILPPRVHQNPTYSSKVFLGGVPWNITESNLKQAFSKIGTIKIEWPGKDLSASQPKGYAYIIFASDANVKTLLDCCTQNYRRDKCYFRISSRKVKCRQVQVIPWSVSDSNYSRVSQKLDPQKTVFVGALHGLISAEALARIMNDNFGGVVYVGLHTDKYKYPIGSGKVAFNNRKSYLRAILAAYLKIETGSFTKKVQIDPYLEDSKCSSCLIEQGPYFCREIMCLRYFCQGCWTLDHSTEGLRNHKILTKNLKYNYICPASYVL